MPDPPAMRRRALSKSALDYVLESATALQRKLGTQRPRAGSISS